MKKFEKREKIEDRRRRRRRRRRRKKKEQESAEAISGLKIFGKSFSVAAIEYRQTVKTAVNRLDSFFK